MPIARYAKITAKGAFASDVVGYTFVTVGSGCSSWNSGNRVAQLERLAVAPSCRGEGIGERLLASVRARSDGGGIGRIALTALCPNERAHRSYERRGFRRAESSSSTRRA